MASENTPIDPNRLKLEQAARLLSAASPWPVSAAMLQQDIAAGAPTNPDGTINLVHFAAWLVKEANRAN